VRMASPEPLRLTVIGCGYLGITTAASFASLGFDVLGVDVDTARVTQLNDGVSPVYEPGLSDLLAAQISSGRLRFTTSYETAAEHGDVHLVCVATPAGPDAGGVDLSQVNAVAESLFPLLTRPCTVVGKSTVPVGTAAALAQRLRSSAPAGAQAHLAWSPEFLREGYAIHDTLSPDRVVIGVMEDADQPVKVLREVYANHADRGIPVVVVDLATAELAKLAANAFLATKISFINAMAEICEATGADIDSLSQVLGMDARIGRRFLRAGVGFGGGCLPKDVRGFLASADDLGTPAALSFLREVEAINQRQRERLVQRAGTLLEDSWARSRVAVLGAAFKPGSDDVRDSPALDIAARIHRRGAQVVVHDPQAMDSARSLWPSLEYAPSTRLACQGADLLLVLTEWPEYVALDPVWLATQVRHARVLDGRNCLDAEAWTSAGWTYRGVGRRTS
jgi:UDPglucose 6-dehydrogenase